VKNGFHDKKFIGAFNSEIESFCHVLPSLLLKNLDNRHLVEISGKKLVLQTDIGLKLDNT